MASTFGRLLLIHWEYPSAPLETFLVPPQGGVDWRVPEWLVPELKNKTSSRMAAWEDAIIKFSRNPQVRMVRVKYQSHYHGQEYYDANRIDSNDPTYAQVYHDLWRIIFTPVPEIAHRIETQMEVLGLIPGQYVSIHLRALYGVETRDKDIVQWWAHNAVHCATTKLPVYYAPGNDETKALSLPILFVSDSTFAIEVASDYAESRGIEVVHRPHQGQQPLHLEKGNSTDIQDYYDTFVDVYMIGMSRCVAYNMGGYGRWGSMMGYNSSCVYHMKANMIPCDFTKKGRRKEVGVEQVKPILSKPLFLPPMAGAPRSEHAAEKKDDSLKAVPTTDTTILVQSASNLTQSAYRVTDENIFGDPLLYARFDTEKWGMNLWDRSKSIPWWMKKYFKWHKQQRRRHLNPEGWKSMKFLVMECRENQPNCGGTSDRLKPLPTMLRMAAVTDRFLLIHWTRPSKLEEFLLPPKGGVDWRVPEWLRTYCIRSFFGFFTSSVLTQLPLIFLRVDPLIAEYGLAATLGDDVRELVMSQNAFVRTKYQSYDGGQNWYNEQLNADEIRFNELYHDVWQLFFTPSPPVAKRIKAEMDMKGLVPGEYASAHVRALYAVQFRHMGSIKRWTVNALNCASTLRPGKPIFLASDSTISSEIADAYGKYMHTTIVTHQSNPSPPLHLDKADNVTDTTSLKKHPPSDYYDTFIDLYLLALGRCTYFSKGGYGSWAMLIGGNTSCAIKFKRSKAGIQNPCDWAGPPDGSKPEKARLTEPLFLQPMGFN
jgi:hypothetical protein